MGDKYLKFIELVLEFIFESRESGGGKSCGGEESVVRF